MKKIAKRLLTLVILLLIIVIILAVVIIMHIDSVIKYGTQTAGTTALGVPVKVEKAHLALTQGSIEFDQFSIQNPPGYQTEHLINIGNFTAQVDMGTIFTDTIVIDIIRLSNMTITYEQRGVATNNIQDIIDHIKEYAGPSEQPEEDASKRQLRIEVIELIDPAVTVKILPIGGQLDAVTVRPGNITIPLGEIQDGSKRAPIVIQEAFIAILTKALEAAGQDLPDQFANAVRPMVNQAKQVFADMVDTTVRDIEETINENIGNIRDNIGNNIGENIGNILQPKQRSDEETPQQ